MTTLLEYEETKLSYINPIFESSSINISQIKSYIGKVKPAFDSLIQTSQFKKLQNCVFIKDMHDINFSSLTIGGYDFYDFGMQEQDKLCTLLDTFIEAINTKVNNKNYFISLDGSLKEGIIYIESRVKISSENWLFDLFKKRKEPSKNKSTERKSGPELSEIIQVAKDVFSNSKYNKISEFIKYNRLDETVLNIFYEYGGATICYLQRSEFDSYFKMSHAQLNNIYNLFKQAGNEIKRKNKNTEFNVVIDMSEIWDESTETAFILFQRKK